MLSTLARFPDSPEKNSVLAQQSLLQIKDDALPIILGATLWEQAVTQDPAHPNSFVLAQHLHLRGFPPVTSYERVQQEQASESCSKVCTLVATGKLTAELLKVEGVDGLIGLLPDAPPEDVRSIFAFINRQVELDSVDLSELRATSPFPVDAPFYLDRVLSSPQSTPDLIARHLRLSMPFLVRLQSFLEAVGSRKTPILSVEVDHDGEMALPHSKRDYERETFGYLLAALARTSDILGCTELDGGPKRHITIELPPLSFSFGAILSPPESIEVMGAVYDFLLFGETSKVLTEPLCSHAERNNLKDLAADILSLQKSLSRATTPSPKASPAGLPGVHQYIVSAGPDQGEVNLRKRVSNPKAQVPPKSFSSTVVSSKREIARLKSELGQLKSEIKRRVPLVRRLEDLSERYKAGFRAAKEQLKAAGDLKPGELIFTRLSEGNTNLPGVEDSLKPLELLLGQSTALGSDFKSLRLFRESTFVLPKAVTLAIHGFAMESSPTELVRTFSFPAAEVIPSIGNLLPGSSAGRIASSDELSIAIALKRLGLPGVTSNLEVFSVARERLGTKVLNPIDLLSFWLPRIPSIDRGDLLHLLSECQRVGIRSIPGDLQKLCVERFGISQRFFNQYHQYVLGFNPVTIGELPKPFSNISTLENFMSIDLASYGLAQETKDLSILLEKYDVVCVVDRTNYHPEFINKDTCQNPSCEAQDREETQEPWGVYVRPGARLIDNFKRSIMERRIGRSLCDRSVIEVSKPAPGFKAAQELYQAFLGIDLGLVPDVTAINDALARLSVYDPEAILIINADSLADTAQIQYFVSFVQKYGMKTILRVKNSVPGIPEVSIRQFVIEEMESRLRLEDASLRRFLEIEKPISDEVLNYMVREMSGMRAAGSDPLNLSLQILHSAALHAKGVGANQLDEQDIVAAFSPIFHLPNGAEVEHLLQAVDRFASEAPKIVVGQRDAIDFTAKKISSHLLALRSRKRPLSLLYPGPTGVGKTELLMAAALQLNIPFFLVQGAEFQEEHRISALLGSPSGYVGPDEGILFKFLLENNMGLIFFDEIEKMHPSVVGALMNFFDTGTLTAGNGHQARRPGMIIAGASNAGAQYLRRGMRKQEVMSILAEHFRDRFNQPRPELIARFQPFPMLAMDEVGFKEVIDLTLEQLGDVPGMASANMRLVNINKAAYDVLYEEVKGECAYNGVGKVKYGAGTIGFSTVEAAVEGYYNLRAPGPKAEILLGDSLVTLAREQYASGGVTKRGEPLLIEIIGHRKSRTLEARPYRGKGTPSTTNERLRGRWERWHRQRAGS